MTIELVEQAIPTPVDPNGLVVGLESGGPLGRRVVGKNESGSVVHIGPQTAAQSSNLDTSSNLNVPGNFVQDAPLNGTVQRADADFTPSNHGIKCNFTGRVRVRASIHVASSAVLFTSIQARIKKNDVPLGPVSQTGIMDGSAVVEGCLQIDHEFDVELNDLIEVGTRPAGGAGIVALAEAGTSWIHVERIG